LLFLRATSDHPVAAAHVTLGAAGSNGAGSSGISIREHLLTSRDREMSDNCDHTICVCRRRTAVRPWKWSYAATIVCCVLCPPLSRGQGAVGATSAIEENHAFSRLNICSAAGELALDTKGDVQAPASLAGLWGHSLNQGTGEDLVIDGRASWLAEFGGFLVPVELLGGFEDKVERCFAAATVVCHPRPTLF